MEILEKLGLLRAHGDQSFSASKGGATYSPAASASSSMPAGDAAAGGVPAAALSIDLDHPAVLAPEVLGRATRRSDDLDPRFPVEAGRKKLELFERKEDARSVDLPLIDEEYEVFTDIQRSKARIAQVKEMVRGTSYDRSPRAEEDAPPLEDHPAIVAEKEKLSRLESKLARINARREKVRSVLRSTIRLFERIERYADEGRGFASLAPVLPAKGDTVEKISARIASLRADLAETEAAPWPSADAKERAATEIDFLAARGAITVGGMIDNRNSLSWPAMDTDVRMGKPDERGTPDPYDRKILGPEMALVAWLFRDQLVERLHREIDEIADDERALSADERSKRSAGIRDAILKEERALAEIIWRDELHELWPADIDPRAVLGIDGSAPKELWS